MLLDRLDDPQAARSVAQHAFELMQRLYPICRSITGDGVRRTLDHIATWAPLQRHEVASGTPAFDWQVPDEWNIRDAYVADAGGQRLIDFRAHTLHVVSYSTPVDQRLSRDELEPHLHSLPQHPDRIPYRTSYYRQTWGFCLRHADRERLGPGPFDVVIDSDLRPGHLSYGECVVDGAGSDEALIYTHTCHPSLANDNLSGIAVAAALARAMREARPQLTWRFVFAPGTIGSLTWLSRNEALLPRLRAGLVIGLLGDRGGELTYKRSRNGRTLIDRAAHAVLAHRGGREIDFEPYGYDERQFCSPGFDLPVGRLTRSPNGAYDEYHSSADDLSLIDVDALAGAIQALAAIIGAVDGNRRFANLSPKGEPQLGKRGLYGALGGRAPEDFEQGLLWLLNQSDGTHDLVDIAQRSKLPLATLMRGADALEAAGLLAALAPHQTTTRRLPREALR